MTGQPLNEISDTAKREQLFSEIAQFLRERGYEAGEGGRKKAQPRSRLSIIKPAAKRALLLQKGTWLADIWPEEDHLVLGYFGRENEAEAGNLAAALIPQIKKPIIYRRMSEHPKDEVVGDRM